MSDTETLVKALRILARDIESGDDVANAAIAEAADRLEELARDLEVTGKQLSQHELLIEENLRLKERIKRLFRAGDRMFATCYIDAQRNEWIKAKKAKP